MPCYKHMYDKQLAPAKDRLEMCRLATKHDRRIQVFDYEIKNEFGGETYHLVKQLMSEDFAKDKFEFTFVIGGDNAATFDKWVNYQDLEKMIPFIVIPRQGVTLKDMGSWYLKPPHTFLYPETPIPNISSTSIRSALQDREDHPKGPTSRLVTAGAEVFLHESLNMDVLQYILKNNLYKGV
jgi:nicotinate-nucleotide adenylyltransferase